MAFEGFLSLGGTEIANASRTKAYADELVPLLGLQDCWGCADLAEVLEQDAYTTPIIDRPDWFSEHDQDSWDFCGFYPLEIEGLDDGVREATVTELALDGAVVGAPRYKSREIKVTGLLIGVSSAAVTYGLTWLGKALEGAPCRDAEGCTGDHLCYYSACPPMCSDSPALDEWPNPDEPSVRHHESLFYLCDGGLVSTWQRACSVDYERTLYQVSLTSGPSIVERYNSSCGHMVRVEFTLVAGVPFAFSTAVSAVPGMEPVPDPQMVPEVACTPGTDVVVRTNLATNPIPIGNATGSGDGWLADGSVFTAAVDTDVVRLEGDASVRVTRNAITEPANLAPNPEPEGDLDGWDYRLGQSSVGPARTNLVENPWPRLADGWDYNVPAGQPGTILRTNYARNPAPSGGANTINGVNGLATYGTGTGEAGVTMTSEVPLSSAVVRTNLGPNPRGAATPAQGWAGGGSQSWTHGYAAPGTAADGVSDPPARVGFQYATATADATGNVYALHGASATWASVVEGETYGARMWIYAPPDAPSSLDVQLRGSWRDATGAVLPGVTDFAIQLRQNPSGWELYQGVTTAAPAGAAFLSVFPWWIGYSAGGGPHIMAGQTVAWAARIVEHRGDAPLDYFDGSSGSVDLSGDRRYLHAWTGAVNTSTSTQALSVAPMSLSPEGTGFARRVVTTAKTAGSTGWNARTTAYLGNVPDGTSGDQASVSMWVRYVGSAGAKSTRLRIEFYNGSTQVTLSDSAAITLPSGEWVRVSHTAAATGDYTQVRWWAYQIGAASGDQVIEAGGVLDVANVLIERSATVGAWFDGDTTDTDDAAYSWTGTPGASESIAQALDSDLFTVPMDIEPDELGPFGEAGIARHTQGVADTKAWNVTYTGTQVVADGVTHTQSLYFRSTSQRQVQFGGRTFDVPGYGWVRLTGQFVGDGGPLTLTVSGTGQATGEVIDVARALVEAGTSLGTYFDGSSPTADGYTYAWTGAEDASTSTATLLPVEATTTLATGDGPGDQTTFQRTTTVAPKAGGEDGPAYSMAAGEGLYTATMQVRPSVAVTAYLRVSALDAAGTVLTSVSGDPLSVPGNAWTQMLPVRIAAPAGTERLQVAVLMPGDEVLPAGATFDAGAVRVIDGVFLTDPTIARATFLGQHDDATNTIDVTAGGVYTASLYAGSNVGAVATMVMRFYNSSGTPVQLVRGPQVDLDAWTTPIGVAEWHRPAVTATAPTGAVGAVVSIEVTKVASGARVGDAAWLTSMLFEQSQDVLSYFDGSTPDLGQASYEWTGTANTSTSQALLALAPPPSPILDPDCPAVPAPPRPPVIDISCVDTPAQWRRYVIDVDADLVPEWRDAVPIIRMQTGATDVRQVRVRFYPNPLQAPLQALNPCDYCGEFVITYIPPRSLLQIDGIRQWASVTRADGTVQTANHLLASSDGGPVEWPVLGCGVAYTLVVDVSPVAVADLEPQICLAARS